MEGGAIQPRDPNRPRGHRRTCIYSSPSEIITNVHQSLVPCADLSSNLSEKLSDMRTIRCIAGFFAQRPRSLFHRKATEQFVFHSDRLSTAIFSVPPLGGITPPPKGGISCNEKTSVYLETFHFSFNLSTV